MDSWSGLKIDIRELREVFERLITHLEQTRGESVTLHEDYFYSLPFPGIYEVTNDPSSPTIGQLTNRGRTSTAPRTSAPPSRSSLCG